MAFEQDFWGMMACSKTIQVVDDLPHERWRDLAMAFMARCMRKQFPPSRRSKWIQRADNELVHIDELTFLGHPKATSRWHIETFRALDDGSYKEWQTMKPPEKNDEARGVVLDTTTGGDVR